MSYRSPFTAFDGANASLYALRPEFLDLPECALTFTHFRETLIENNQVSNSIHTL